MNIDILFALVLFALASSLSPGPNNLMLMTSGVNFGFRLTLPHMFGVSMGFVFMTVLVGLGVMQLFDAYPITYNVLKVLSVLYMLYLAAKIAMSSNEIEGKRARSMPMTFFQAVMFQWVNPKAWSMSLTAISVFAPSKSFASVCLVALVFGLVNFPCIACWASLGTKIKRWLTKPSSLQVFNYCMAGLLVLSLYPIFA
ncbi:LysE family translocator [Glaciecola sp. SC05]|uniref:LysE family translocator n=1 Tax=Glaciecola sp. SC05 TaxID=1987355 RepID=UPI003527E74B